MTIENLGVKLYSGTKSDRVSDSLGSSANGVINGITLLKSGTVTATINSSSNDSYSTFDIGTALSTNWVLRWKQDSTTNDLVLNSSNAGALYVGLSEVANISTDQNGSSGGNLYTRYRHESGNWYVDGFDIRVRSGSTTTAGGNSGAGALSRGSITYYVELTKNGSSSTVKYFSDSGYSQQVGSTQTVDGTGAGSSLQYLGIHTVSETVSSGSLVVECSEFKIYDNQTSAGTPTYTDFTGTWATSGTKVVVGDVKLGTGAYSFDGTDDYVKISNSLDAMVSGDFSVAGWVYFDNANTGTSHETILRKGSGSTYASPYHDFFLYQYNTGVSLTVNDGSTYQTLTGTAGTSTVGWHHVCVTRASNVYTLYVDGISNGTLSHTTSFGTQPWYFGCSENGTGTFERELYGKLDDWGCWSRVLTATEISDLVNKTDKATDVTDDLTTDKGWVSNTSDWTYNTSDYLDFATIRRSTTSQEMYIDLQDSDYLGSGNNLHASEWVVRLGKFTTGTLSSSGNVMFFIGLSNDEDADSGESQQSIFATINYSSSEGGIYGYCTTGNLEQGSNRVTGTVSTPLAASTDYWIEISRNSNVFTVKSYSDEYITQTGSLNLTKTGLSGLRYLKILNDSEQNGGTATGSKLYGDIKIWNGTTSASTNDGALVSSLSDKSNLKANYTMDSTSLGATETYSQDFNGSVTYLNSGAYTISSTVSNAWNASIANTGHTGAETTIDLGTTIDGGSFVMDYTMKADNITNYVFFWLGLGSVSGAGYEDSQNFVGAMSTLQGSASNGDIRGGYKDSSATWNGGTNSAGNYFPAGTTRYCRLVKDGTTITAYIYPTEADRTAGTNATTSSAKTSSPATLSGLKYLQILVSNYNDGKTNTATIDDIKIYSGVSVLTGCKNDFSATSALEGLTGVRTNSIFQQTDTPSYWWYNGTSWLLDGTTEKSFDYSSSSGWTTVGSLTTITDGWVNSGGAGNNADNRIYQNTGLTVNNTSWVCDFEFYYTNVDLESGLPVGFYSGTGTPMTANQDMIGIQFGNGGTLHLVYKDGSGSMTSTGSTSVSASTTYYCRLTRTSATEATLKIYTDSARTTQHGSTITQSSLPSSVQGLDYIQHSSTNNGGTGSGQSVWKVTNVKLQNGRTTWL